MFDAIVLADLHWGAIELDRFKYELDRCLFDKINHMKKLDALFIAGDLFDMKEYSSSNTFREVLKFLDKLIAYTEKMETKIVIIKGTRNHDDLQLYTLETIYKDCLRMKFVHSVEEDVIEDVHILYVPEEYVVDQELYYRDFFCKHYDIMIGHGMIDKIWYAKDAKRSGMSSAPVYNVDELCHIANYCYFGHIHEHRAYGKSKKFKYVGPVTVWEYDKSDHGYYVIHYSKETEIMREEYVENTNAQRLKTMPIVMDKDTTSLDSLMHTVESTLERDDYDKLKFIVRINALCPVYIQAKNYLITKTGLYENVNLIIITDDEVKESENEKVEREKADELHETLFSLSMNDDTTISEFIKSKEGKNISLERIREVCGIPNPRED